MPFQNKAEGRDKRDKKPAYGASVDLLIAPSRKWNQTVLAYLAEHDQRRSSIFNAILNSCCSQISA
jgi:hypothetical protein